MKFRLGAAVSAGLYMLLTQAVSAEPVDNQAAVKAQQLRADIAEKQKALAEEQRVEVPAPAAPAVPLELPIDTTDSPGATK